MTKLNYLCPFQDDSDTFRSHGALLALGLRIERMLISGFILVR